MIAGSRKLVGLVTLGLVVVATFWLVGGVAAATPVVPILVDGNATCSRLGELAGQSGWTEFHKAEPVISGSHTVGTRTVSWTVRDTADGQVFDWSADFDLHGVFAKGGNTGGNLYVYPTGARGDEGLHAQVNPGGKWGGLSHISFCYNPTVDTSTTPSTEATTASTEATTASTEATTASTEATTSSTARLEVLETTITAPVSTVAGTRETLPFTGFSDGAVGGIAFALASLGGLVLLAIRRREAEAVVVEEDWGSRLKVYDLKF
jgi:hypothetical protein